jgi:L-ribulose-5-phosphate 3-epimerase
MSERISRRNWMAGMAGVAAANAAAQPAAERFTICVFSKHFHWASVPETAEVCAKLGYEGIDLTLRKGGHVLPERVADDLPKAVEAIRKAGLTIPMVTSHIVDAGTPHAEEVVKTLAALGIRHYRWGGFRYSDKEPIAQQLESLKPRVRDLAALNKQYGVCAMYHTHSGIGQVGACMWDLWLLLKDHDPNLVSANYDIAHATVEGGFGGWIHSARLLMPYMKGVAVKDFLWRANEKGVWRPAWRPMGEGMVNFRQFFAMLKEARFAGPLQVHMEYPELAGADTGQTTFKIPKEKLLAIMQRDIDFLKRALREGGLL